MILLYLMFVGGGIGQIFQESLGYMPERGISRDSGAYYLEIIQQQDFMLNLSFSLYLALAASFLSMVFGIVTAYCYINLEQRFIRKFAYYSLQLGLILPYIFIIFLGMIYLTKTGLLSRLLYQVGMVKDFTLFPTLVFDQLGIGIMWVYIFKGTPFVALFVLNSMGKVNPTYADVAKTLGATNFVIFKKIYLPLCAEAVIWSTIVLFAYDLGSFEVPYLLSPLSPLPLSAQLYSLYSQSDVAGISKAMAMSMIILVSGGLTGVIYALGLQRVLRGRR